MRTHPLTLSEDASKAEVNGHRRCDSGSVGRLPPPKGRTSNMKAKPSQLATALEQFDKADRNFPIATQTGVHSAENVIGKRRLRLWMSVLVSAAYIRVSIITCSTLASAIFQRSP